VTNNSEILLEGSYKYLDKEQEFAQENFKLLNFPDDEVYQIYSEILSRVETGEFLKIIVRYDMDYHFAPLFLRTEKSLGTKFVEETFKIEHQTQECFYQLKNSIGIQEFKRPFGSKHHLASPAFATAAVFSLSKKFNATGRTPVTLISSANEWVYREPPIEKMVFAEFKSRDIKDFNLNGKTLTASHLQLHDHDSSHTDDSAPVDMWLSKHFSLPYMMTHEEQKIVTVVMKKY